MATLQAHVGKAWMTSGQSRQPGQAVIRSGRVRHIVGVTQVKVIENLWAITLTEKYILIIEPKPPLHKSMNNIPRNCSHGR